jgi:purine-binding chemotaxis protein CheW
MDKQKNIIDVNTSENMHLSFVLDEQIYAINVKYVLEITTLPLISEPQKMPEYIIGILNYNELFVNVLDIRKIFSLPQKKYELTNKVLVIKGEESLFAIIVDEVSDFFTTNPTQHQRVMGENFGDIIKNFYRLDDKVLNLISIPSLEEFVKKVDFKENKTDYKSLFPSDEESVIVLNRRKNEIAAIPQMNLDVSIYGKDQYIIFKLGEHNYCLYSLYIKELVSPKNFTITQIPYASDFVKGIINLKGDFYTVINLKQFIGIDNEIHNKNTNINNDCKMIIIDSADLKLALWVDNVVDIINISEDNIELKNNPELSKLYIKAEVLIDGKVYNILNIEKLISDEKLYINS